MLHTICFVRMLGLVTPRTRVVHGVRMVRLVRLTQPCVDDAGTSERMQRVAYHLLTALDKQSERESTCVDVVLGWHRLAPPAPSVADDDMHRARTASPDLGKTHYAVFESPYSWLASAIAGGRSSKHDAQRTAEREPRRLLPRDTSLDTCAAEVFEQWVLCLRVDYKGTKTRDALPHALQSFLSSALAFANAHQSQIPPMIDAGICPFPLTINSTIRAR